MSTLSSPMLEKFGLGAPHVALLDNRVVTIVGGINQQQAQMTIDELLFLDATFPGEPVTLQIMSNGGEIAAGLAILDTCRRISGEVSTVGTGTCASMGALLLVGAGAPGRRYATEHAQLMLHQPIGAVQGSATEIEAATALILRTREVVEGIIAESCGLAIEKVRELCRCGDRWFDPDEACEIGLIDHVIRPR